MKPKLKWALAAAAVLLVGFVSLQQTGALWRSEASGDGTTITAGRLDLSVGDGVKEFTLDGLSLEDASPGDSVQKALPVHNSGNVALSYRLNNVVTNGSDGNQALPLLLRVSRVSDENDCAGTGNVGESLFNGAITSAATADHVVAPGATDVLCLRVTIADNAALGVDGTTATFAFGATTAART